MKRVSLSSSGHEVGEGMRRVAMWVDEWVWIDVSESIQVEMDRQYMLTLKREVGVKLF